MSTNGIYRIKSYEEQGGEGQVERINQEILQMQKMLKCSDDD